MMVEFEYREKKCLTYEFKFLSSVHIWLITRDIYVYFEIL